MFRFLIVCFFLLPVFVIGQDSVAAKKMFRKWDTTRYQKFDYVFIVGVYQQYRNFELEFKQTINRDTIGLSTHKLVAESPLNSGISFSFDKFQLSLSTGNTPRALTQGKGSTQVFNIGFNIGDNNYLVENYYRRFSGFYNSNPKLIDSAEKSTTPYYLEPSLRTDIFMSRFMFFSHPETFSFKAGFGCNYRQLKSAATWILGGSLNGFGFKSDSSVIPSAARHLFNDYANLKGFVSYNVSLHAGAAGTLVLWKAWFATGYFTLGPEQQWRNYNFTDHYSRLSYLSVSGTFRVSLGLNMRKFYLLGSYNNDYNVFNSAGLNFKSGSISGNFTFGWRFNTGNPPFYQKFQQTKIYKFL